VNAADGLRAEGIVVSFGGLRAVQDVSLHAPRGRITALIGPNGAGKTTFFNACAGWVSAQAGRVSIDGRDVTHLSPGARARRGLGRTYQRMELFEDLTVAQNVAIGREATLAGRSVLRQILSSRAERSLVADAAHDAMVRCGIQHLAGEVVWTLSTGQRRLVELARALAGPFSVLMLDEPSSGLDNIESAALGRLLRAIQATRDLAILLVEHDMPLVMETSDYIYVLEYGRPIFEGTAAEVSASDAVRHAYLGFTA
jgi:ABC-type branched-subunit amino acid transport system ATPase component